MKLIEAAHPGVILGGRLYVGTVRQPLGAPLVDGCTTTSHTIDNDTRMTVRRHYFAGVAIQPRPTRRWALVLGRHGVTPPALSWLPRWARSPR